VSNYSIREATDSDLISSNIDDGSDKLKELSADESSRLEYFESLPRPDDQRGKSIFQPTIPFSATKRLTRDARSLFAPLGFGYTSTALREAGAPSTVQALLGLPADVGQNLLATLGTGFLGAASIPAEIYGATFADDAMDKKRFARAMGGAVEAQPLTAVARGYSGARALQQQPTKTIAREAQDIGVTPPAKTLGPTTAGIVGTLEELPIVKGTLLDETERLASETAEVAARAAPRPQRTTYEAGEKLKKGVESFGERTQKRQDQLFKRVDELIPPETKFEAANTVSFLNEIKESWAGFKSAAKETGDASLLSFLDDLETLGPVSKAMRAAEEAGDTDAIKLLSSFGDDAELTPQRFEALRRLRTAVGDAISDSGGLLNQTVGKGNLKRLYRHLSDDIDSAANSMGPKAAETYKRANNYFKKRRETIEGAINDIAKVDDPEKAYNIFLNIIKSGGAKESQQSVIKLQKVLSKDEFAELSNNVFARMGKLENVKEGDVPFSPDKWIADFERLSPYARKTLADSAGGKGTSEEMVKLARYIKLASEEQNPRLYRFRRALNGLGLAIGAGTVGLYGGMAGGAAGTAAGLVAAGATIATGGLALSKLLTNKKFLTAMNRMAINDIGPMRALAISKDSSANAAKSILYEYEKD